MHEGKLINNECSVVSFSDQLPQFILTFMKCRDDSWVNVQQRDRLFLCVVGCAFHPLYFPPHQSRPFT